MFGRPTRRFTFSSIVPPLKPGKLAMVAYFLCATIADLLGLSGGTINEKVNHLVGRPNICSTSWRFLVQLRNWVSRRGIRGEYA